MNFEESLLGEGIDWKMMQYVSHSAAASSKHKVVTVGTDKGNPNVMSMSMGFLSFKDNILAIACPQVATRYIYFTLNPNTFGSQN